MLEIEVVGRDDLSRIIERKSVSNHDCSLLELIKQECPKYKESYIPNLSACQSEEFQKIKNRY